MNSEIQHIEALRQSLRKAVAVEEQLSNVEAELEEVWETYESVCGASLESFRIFFKDKYGDPQTLKFDQSDNIQIKEFTIGLLNNAVQRRRIEVLQHIIRLQQKR